jgi:serpin B
MKALRLFGMAALILGIASCSDDEPNIEQEENKTDNAIVTTTIDNISVLAQTEYTENLDLTEAEENVNNSVNKFSFDLFNEIAEDPEIVLGTEKNDNISVSPLGVALCLGLEANGVDDASSLKIAKLFGANSISDYNTYCKKLMQYLPFKYAWSSNELQLANSAWLSNKYAFNKHFLSSLNDNFFAEAYNVDFTNSDLQRVIDKWCSLKTNGVIDSLPFNINGTEVCLLLNAMYFKSSWASAFEKQLTTKADFAGTKGTESVDMMRQVVYFSLSKDNDVTAITLPYSFSNYEMVIVMPNESTDINAFSKSFNYDAWTSLLDTFNPAYVDISMPKFIIEHTLSLQPVLNKASSEKWSDTA